MSTFLLIEFVCRIHIFIAICYKKLDGANWKWFITFPNIALLVQPLTPAKLLCIWVFTNVDVSRSDYKEKVLKLFESYVYVRVCWPVQYLRTFSTYILKKWLKNNYMYNIYVVRERERESKDSIIFWTKLKKGVVFAILNFIQYSKKLILSIMKLFKI